MPVRFCVASLLVLSFYLSAGEEAAPSVPPDVQAAMAALPSEAKPLGMLCARNGALYALLPNGCELIVKEKHDAPVVTVQGWVRTGAVDEGQWLGAGLSHFSEHLMFKGTTKRPTGVLDQQIRGAGGDDNAYTTSERTVFHITTQAEGFDVSFYALADMLMDSTFPPEEVTKEHAVVYKEIERALDNPEAMLWETFDHLRYQVHPYRVPVLGYPDLFKRVSRDQVFAYYKERYSPQMSAFIAVGDFDAKTVMPKMATTLGAWPRKSVAPTTVPEEPEQVAPRFAQIVHPLCEVPKLVVGYPSVPLRHPDLYALDLLASILGDGRASRLYRTVKDKLGLALEITAFDNTPMYAGYFGVLATVEPEKVDAARAAIAQVLEEARIKKPSDEELARAKRKVLTERIFSQITADGVASTLGSDWFVAGDLDFSDDYAQRMQNVTADDVLRVARQYLVPRMLNTVVMLPPAAAAQSQAVPVQKETATNKALKDELAQLQHSPAVAKADLVADRAVFEFTLKPSGVRVVVREDHALPEVNLALAALGGTRWEPAELAGAGKLLAEMLDRGTAKLNKLKIAEEAEDMGATLATFSGRNSFGVTISGLKDDTPKLMSLAADCLLHPAFPKDELEKLRGDTLEQIAQEDESLPVVNSKILRPLLYGNHPYARQALGTAETVKKVTADDLQKLHEAWVHPENLAVSFIGDITALEALKLAQQSFSELKPGQFTAPKVPPIAPLTEGKSGETSKAGLTGAVLTLGFQGATLLSPDRERLDLLAGLLSGLGGRLNVSLREKQGLAYAVGVQNDPQLDGGAIVFFIQTDAKSLDKSLAGMWVEINKLRDEPVPPKELETVKNYVAGNEAIELQNQRDLTQRLALAELYGEGAANVFDRKARLEKVTAEELKTAADKFLDPQHWAKAVVKAK